MTNMFLSLCCSLSFSSFAQYHYLGNAQQIINAFFCTHSLVAEIDIDKTFLGYDNWVDPQMFMEYKFGMASL